MRYGFPDDALRLGQLSVDSNANVTKKMTIVRNKSVFLVFFFRKCYLDSLNLSIPFSHRIQTHSAPVATNATLRNGEQVTVVNAGKKIDSVSSAYVRSVASDVDYFDVVNRVTASSVNARYLSEVPKKNDIVAVPHRGVHCRAFVLKAESTKRPILVKLLDYGINITVNFSEIKKLSVALQNAKRFVVLISFDEVHHGTNNKKGFELLQRLAIDRDTTFTIHSSSNKRIICKKSKVKLINTETLECLNAKLEPPPPPPMENNY